MGNVRLEYLLDRARRSAEAATSGFRVLDFGCGSGELVEIGRSRGLDMVGADLYYAGSTANDRESAIQKGLLGKHVFEMTSTTIPFPDATFDYVIANTVFEHVPDLEVSLKEIARVLKPSGTLLAVFPVKGSIREAHIGIPFAHWFPKTRMRSLYTSAMYRMGFGYHRDGRSADQWSLENLEWIDRYTFYRSSREVRKLCRPHFSPRHVEWDQVAFRLQVAGRLLLSKIVRWPILRNIIGAVFVAFGQAIIDARRTTSCGVEVPFE